MSKKIINIFGIIFIFIIGFVIHDLYDWFPSFITIIISPVSESIFEHLKMIITSYIIWIIFKYFLYKKNNLTENNFIFKEIITIIFQILFFTVVFYPIYKVFGENLLLTLSIYFVTISISQILNYFIQFKKDSNVLNTIGLIIIFIIYVITTYLTYKPPINDFFLDPTNNSYGINK
ncbi:MAG: DUF6512 family protein [bacterium]|nr:DUF6512 family protein [bacterium]